MNPAVENLGVLMRSLRKLHFKLGPKDWEAGVRALETMGECDRVTMRAALKALWCRTRDEVVLFEVAFEAWVELLRRPERPSMLYQETYLTAVARQRRGAHLKPSPNWLMRPPEGSEGRSDQGLPVTLTRGASGRETLSDTRLDRLSDSELALLLDGMRPTKPLTMKAHRTRPGRTGIAWNPRDTMHRGQVGSEWLTLWFDSPEREPMPVTVLLDLSGSMQGYHRPLTIFLHALAHRERRLEVFAFSTRLTALTRALRYFHVDQALSEVALLTPDRGGGTRLSESLEILWRRERGRGVRPRSRLVLISDGMETGDGVALGVWLSRFSRYLGGRIYWWNPYGVERERVRTPSLHALLTVVEPHRIGTINELWGAWGSLDGGRK